MAPIDNKTTLNPEFWKSVTRPDGQVLRYYDSTGGAKSSKPVLVLLHSFICNSEYMWRQLMTDSESSGLGNKFRVLACDMRGHGRSGPMTARVTSLDDLAADTLALVDDSGAEGKVTFCGLSIGGMISMRIAIANPERVEKLVLLNTDAHATPLFTKVQQKVFGFLIVRLGWGPLMGTVGKSFFTKISKPNKKLLRKMLDSQDAKSLVGILGPLNARKDIIEQLKLVNIPAIVMHGTVDKALPFSNGKDIAKALPKSQFVELKGAGHLSSMQFPDKIREEMFKFLL